MQYVWLLCIFLELQQDNINNNKIVIYFLIFNPVKILIALSDIIKISIIFIIIFDKKSSKL